MEDWLSYRLGDFLMFSGRTYWRLFQLENATLWPLPVLAPALGAVGVAVAATRPEGVRLLVLLLALAWAWTGWSFVWARYAPINWGIAYAAPLFGLQALVLAYAAARRVCGPPTLRGGRAFAALGLLGWGLLLHPLAAPLFGRPLAQAEVAGIAPDPTAIATMGVGLLLPSRPMRLAVLAISALWLGASALTLWLLGAPERFVPVLALVVAAAGLAARYRDA